MKTKTSKPTKALSLLLSCSLLLTLLTPSALAAEKVTPPDGKILIEQTDYTLTQGVTETDVFLNESSGNAQIAGYMLTVSPDAKVTFKASYKGYYAAGSTLDSRKNSASNLTWGLESSTNQAKDYERATGGNVLAATNGDYYNMQTGQPLGYLIMEGNVVQKNNGSSKEPYFAVLKDGSYAIREFGADCSDVQEAISGPFFLVRNGQVAVDASNADLMPRNSIGIKEDGTVVTFVADGRQYPYSVGMTIYDQACYLQKQGVVDAIYLDGGMEAAQGYILDFIRTKAEEVVKSHRVMDYKTTLQEIVQKNHEEVLSYRLKSESGPDHDKRFVMEVLINSVLAEGEGHSKKLAEQAAAKAALALMGQ